MAFERWGSQSVKDHVDTAALVANVLLYDRLVFPVITAESYGDKKPDWIREEWNADLQAKRLDDLGDLAIRRPWNAARHEKFKTRQAELAAEQHDAAIMDSFQLTRKILAQEQVVKKPPGVHDVQVIAAYNSQAAVNEDFQLADTSENGVKENLAAQALLITRRLAIPDLPDKEDALRLAVNLSRENTDFRSHRAALFEWQERAATKRVTPKDAVDELAELTDQYNQAVQAAHRKVLWKLAFTVCGVGAALAGGLTAVAGVSAGIALVRFWMFDREPVIDAGDAKPAAMFHDIEARIGVKLSAAG